MNKLQKVLIISFSPIARDPRVLRQINSLKDEYDLMVIGIGDYSDQKQGVSYYSVNKKRKKFFQRIYNFINLLLKRYEKVYWASNEIKETLKIIDLNNYVFNLIIANDIQALPIAMKLASDKPVLFDAHEYYADQLSSNLLNLFLFTPYRRYLCDQYIPNVSKMITVSDGIKQQYEQDYNIKATIITNAPFYEAQKPKPVQADNIRIIHHGIASPNRNIEVMMNVIDYLDKRFTLDLMLIPGSIEYYKKILKIVQTKRRISMVVPVNANSIAKKINDYDIGLFILEPKTYNQKHALPNKLFEYIQGRLCIAVGPSIEMANLVNSYKLGVVADTFKSIDMARKLNSLTNEDIYNFKIAADKAAKELSAEKNSILLKKIVKNLIDS